MCVDLQAWSLSLAVAGHTEDYGHQIEGVFFARLFTFTLCIFPCHGMNAVALNDGTRFGVMELLRPPPLHSKFGRLIRAFQSLIVMLFLPGMPRSTRRYSIQKQRDCRCPSLSLFFWKCGRQLISWLQLHFSSTEKGSHAASSIEAAQHSYVFATMSCWHGGVPQVQPPNGAMRVLYNRNWFMVLYQRAKG